MSEILAPCGAMESLIAAVNAGADAVYLGEEYFSARKMQITLPQSSCAMRYVFVITAVLRCMLR